MRQAEVGRQLRRLREAQPLGLVQCATRAGISPGHLSEIERGVHPLWPSYGWKLSCVLGVGVLELVDANTLLSEIDVGCGKRRTDLDGRGLRGFQLPGGIEVRIPVELAQRANNGRRKASATVGG